MVLNISSCNTNVTITRSLTTGGEWYNIKLDRRNISGQIGKMTDGMEGRKGEGQRQGSRPKWSIVNDNQYVCSSDCILDVLVFMVML